MRPVVREAVERVWTHHVGIDPSWTRAQTIAFLDREAERLSLLIDQLSADGGHRAIQDWKRAHNGMPPDFMTNVGLLNTVDDQCQELVLTQQLYELIPIEDEDEEWLPTPPTPDPHDPQRWKTGQGNSSTDETDELVAAVLPGESASFRISVGFLWQQRLEDELPLPLPPGTLAATGNHAGERRNQALLEDLVDQVRAHNRALGIPDA